MRIEIPQIFWHGNRDRILSIDFYPNSNIIVTCGAEEEKMWIKVNLSHLINSYGKLKKLALVLNL
jgi:hypothetical protein